MTVSCFNHGIYEYSSSYIRTQATLASLLQIISIVQRVDSYD